MNTKSPRLIAALSALAFAVVLTIPRPGQAQQSSAVTLAPADAAVAETVATPMVDNIPSPGPRVVQAGISRHVSDTPIPMAPAATRRNIAWMAVGGAALVVGLMIGGDGGTIIALTGGVLGLVGLFRYMQ